MIIGCDAITNKGDIYNKIGSEMIAEIAKSRKIKVYICGRSWKLDPNTFFGFDEKIEQRNEKEIWRNSPAGVIISNYAFEKVHPKNITGIISEFGILKPKEFVRMAKKRNKWMFE
jgi:translation initiation factor 2B subunit (eIF-2B alpha/beta/delta family)